LENQSSPNFARPIRPSAALPSPAASHESDGHYSLERGTYADAFVNRVIEDITPTFLGVSGLKPILSCVVKGAQLPLNKGPVGANDLDATNPRSIINPQPSTVLLDGIDVQTAHGLYLNFLDRVITQYPVYHRNDITSAFNSIYHPASNPGQDTPRNKYIMSLVMAISLSTAARTKQRVANSHASLLVSSAIRWIPSVATNDLQGLQAILLLAQYSFLNPSMADVWLLTGLISQAVIDLGLHQELPNDSRTSAYARDMRRRLFWVAWEMEVAVCSIFSRPINLPTRRYDVAFPVEVDDAYITEDGIDISGRVSKFMTHRIWKFRQIEAEIIAVLHDHDTLPPECSTLEHWMKMIQRSIAEWHKEVYHAAAANKDAVLASRWAEMKLYSDIAYPYILLQLYRPTKRIPQPTNEHFVTAFVSAVQVADGYTKQSMLEPGAIKYVFYSCHHCFSAAIVFLQALSRYKVEISEKFAFQQIEKWMKGFSTCFVTIAERWPAATRCLEEYERLLGPIKKDYIDFLVQKPYDTPHHEPGMGKAVRSIHNYRTSDELQIALNHWTASALNPATTSDITDAIGLHTCNTLPHDWNAEFSLNFSFGQELI
jgi:hypothetical protein